MNVAYLKFIEKYPVLLENTIYLGNFSTRFIRGKKVPVCSNCILFTLDTIVKSLYSVVSLASIHLKSGLTDLTVPDFEATFLWL
jgi:hypothetical protein